MSLSQECLSLNRFLLISAGMVIAIPVALIVWPVSFFGFDQHYFLSTLFSFIGGGAAYGGLTAYLHKGFLKKHGLTKKEYKYINENLKEAKSKIFRVNKALVSIRHIPSLKKRMELIKLIRKINSLTKKEPKRFYLAEQFYFSHLDSAVELAEKHVLLSGQPTNNREIDRSLDETRRTLEKLTESIEEDLLHILSEDIEQLHLEIDVANHSIKKSDEYRLTDESRKSK
jgi:5-bromo-4-chloroindolyl phosphate hydrolysis protein